MSKTKIPFMQRKTVMTTATQTAAKIKDCSLQCIIILGPDTVFVTDKQMVQFTWIQIVSMIKNNVAEFMSQEGDLLYFSLEYETSGTLNIEAARFWLSIDSVSEEEYEVFYALLSVFGFISA